MDSNKNPNKIKHPNKDDLFVIDGIKRTCYLKNIIKNPNIIVGDYTYYDDPAHYESDECDLQKSFEKNVLYHFDFIGDKLRIGNFTQIATDVKFIMNGAYHYLGGYSSFPFVLFEQIWNDIPFSEFTPSNKGDTVIGNDVWIGYGATIMPGINIGDGAVIGTRAVVTKDVLPYAIVGGNRANVIRKRFDDDTIKFLLELKWWSWSIEKIRENIVHIMRADRKALEMVC